MASDSGYVLPATGLILVGLGLLGFGASATAQYFAARAATGFSAEVLLKSSLFAHIQRFAYADLGQARRFDAHQPYDDGREPDADWREHGAAAAAALPVRGVRRDDHGLYRQRSGGADLFWRCSPS